MSKQASENSKSVRMDARQERWRSCGALTLLTQAELVDGFLAWDFDADTAATFFAQQVYQSRK